MKRLLLFWWSFLCTSAQVLNRSGVDSTIFISHDVFLPNYAHETGTEPWDLAAADLDNDGDIDVAVAARMDNLIVLHYNDGKGNFHFKKVIRTCIRPKQVAIADLDLNGYKDVVVVCGLNGSVAWHRQLSKRVFDKMKSVKTGAFPTDLVLKDLNGDSYPDAIVVSNSDNTIKIHYWNNQLKVFEAPKTIPTCPKPRVVDVVDINRDGKLDLVVGGDGYQIRIHYGASANNIRNLRANDAIWGIRCADLDKDGDIDIAVATYYEGTVCFYYNEGVNYRGPICKRSGDYNFGIVIGDLDKDGDLDVATASTRDGTINVHLNDGKGNFSDKYPFKSGDYNTAIVITDVDQDMDLDVLTCSANDHMLNVHRNIPINIPKEHKIKIYGYVKDTIRNKPLRGVIDIYVQVQSEWVSYRSTMASANGFYSVELPYNHTYLLKARIPDYPEAYKKVTVKSRTETPKTLQDKGIRADILTGKPEKAYVTGIVKDKRTGRPLPAKIYFVTQKGKSLAQLQANSDGTFKQSLPLGEHHRIIVEYPLYRKVILPFTLSVQHYKKPLHLEILLEREEGVKACVGGLVLDAKTKKPIPLASIEVQNKNGKILEIVQSSTRGYYKFCLPKEGKYYLVVNHRGYVFKLDSVTLSFDHLGKTTEKNLYLEPIEVNKAYVLRNIYFDYDKATLRPESKAELDRLVRILKENPTMVIEIGGHTDSDGSEEYNLRLSQARAEAVRNYLIRAGIDPKRLKAKGYGECCPVAPNDTPENKQKNRRTEFKVLSF